jgi:hypothetical protein
MPDECLATGRACKPSSTLASYFRCE